MDFSLIILILNAILFCSILYYVFLQKGNGIPVLVLSFILTVAICMFHGLAFGSVSSMEHGILDGPCVKDLAFLDIKPLCNECNFYEYEQGNLCISLNSILIIGQIIYLSNMLMITKFLSIRMREIWVQNVIYDAFGEFFYRGERSTVDSSYNRLPPYATARHENTSRSQKISHTFFSIWFILGLVFWAGYLIPIIVFTVFSFRLKCEDGEITNCCRDVFVHVCL